MTQQTPLEQHVRENEAVADEAPTDSAQDPIEPPKQENAADTTEVHAGGNDTIVRVTDRPALHIDIQVHIDPTSSPEQIDQIFASMAKHLYRTGS